MAKSVKQVLAQKKLPKDYPPTMSDVRMREKHVPESVKYNVNKHMKDHAANAMHQLKKLEMVNPGQAKRLALQSAEVMEKITNQFKEYGHGKNG